VLWSELFDDRHAPLDNQIKEFVDTPLWDNLADYLQQTYNVQPKLFYSGCSMHNGLWKGWNIKYKKSGKPLCTLYPKQGYYISSVAIGFREMDEAELLISQCTEYTRNLFKHTATGYNGKSLAIDVKNENILQDVKNLIALRVGSR